jgi:eukaryotic translation initiation factor 2-alpha kinase 4
MLLTFVRTVAEHPKAQKAAVFDIITTDRVSGAAASTAEMIVVANRILDSFPTLSSSFEIHVSHSTSEFLSSAFSAIV